MWKYLKAVATHPYHLASVALGVGLSAIFQSDILFLLWLMGDASAVYFIAAHPRIQRLIDAYAGRDEEDARNEANRVIVESDTERILAGLATQLPQQYRPQFDRMRGMYNEILKYISNRKRTGSTPVNITLARIHELLLMYFRLACYHANLLRLERPESVQKKIDSKRRALDATDDTRVRAAIEASLETLGDQLDFAKEKQSESVATGIRLENMEEQMRIITHMTITSDDVDAFDVKVNEIWSYLRTELDMTEAMASFTTLQDLSQDPVGHRLVEGEREEDRWNPPPPNRLRN